MRSRPIRPARSFRTQYIAVAFVPALIVTLSITGFVWAQKQVTVVVDGAPQHVKTQAADVAGLLEGARVDVGEGDVVTPPQDAEITDGMTVVVRHSVPVVVRMGDESVDVDVVGATVADALVAIGVDPEANPAVSPAIDTPLEPGLLITVPDSFTRVTQQDVEVPFEVETHEDPSLPKGTTRTIIAGVNGLTMRVYRSVVTNGIEGAPVMTAEQVVSEPVTEILAVGTGTGTDAAAEAKAQLRTARARRAKSLPATAGKKMRVVSTGYSAAEPGIGGGPNTATGHKAVRGVIAVDPDVIPLGTRVYVPGYGYAIAYDTGGAVKGKHIDLCFNTVAECEAWGRRPVTIIILD